MALHKRKQLKADYLDPDALGFSDEEEHPHEQQRKKSKKGSHDDGGTGAHARPARPRPDTGGRTRPTNNQLLYKAYFRWPHYPFVFKPGRASIPSETDACASVTAAFLQVLQTLHYAETLRSAGTAHHRSVLQILSTNTRRTKVVELSSGTHRVPDELKKHYLSDGEGGQYSTNLDRNRYGNDDNYLFTVIRYDLEFLGLCPCMVDVEIIDAKAGNSSVIVSAGPDACTCQHKPDMMAYPDPMGISVLPNGIPPGAAASGAAALAGLQHPALALPAGAPQLQVPKVAPLGINPLQLPQQRTPPIQAAPAATMAPMSEPQLQVAPLLGVEPLQQAAQPQQAPLQQPALQAQGAAAGGLQRLGARSAAVTPADKSTRSRESPKPSTSGVSQLFDALVMAATGGQEGAAAAGDAMAGDPAVTSAFLNALPGAGQGGPEQESNAVRPQSRGPQVHHPPMRNKSRLWSAMSFGDMDSLQNALDAFRADEEIASAYQSSPDAAGAGASVGGENLLRQRRRKPPRGNSSFLLRTGDSLGMDMSYGKLGIKLEGSIDPSMLSALPPGFPGEKSGDNQEPLADQNAAAPADSQEQQLEEGGGGTGDVGTDEVAPGSTGPQERSGGRFRHVPRQASAINLSGRLNTAEVTRLRAEVEHLRAENRRLHDEVQQNVGVQSAANGQAGSGHEMAALQEQLKAARQEAAAQAAARKQAEEQLVMARLELSKVQRELAALSSKALAGTEASSTPSHMAAAAAVGLLNPLAHMQASGLLPHGNIEHSMASLAALNPMVGFMQKQAAAAMYHQFLAQQQALSAQTSGLLNTTGLDGAAAAVAAAMAAGAGGTISPDIAAAAQMLAGSLTVGARPSPAAGPSTTGAAPLLTGADATATPSVQLQGASTVPAQQPAETSLATDVTANGMANGHHTATGSGKVPSPGSAGGASVQGASSGEQALKADVSSGHMVVSDQRVAA